MRQGAIGYEDGSVRFFDANQSNQVAMLKQGTAPIDSIRFKSPTRVVVIGQYTGTEIRTAHEFDLANLGLRVVANWQQGPDG